MTQIERAHNDVYSPPHTSNEDTNVNLIPMQNDSKEGDKFEELVVSDRSSERGLIKGVEVPQLYLKNPLQETINIHQMLKSRNAVPTSEQVMQSNQSSLEMVDEVADEMNYEVIPRRIPPPVMKTAHDFSIYDTMPVHTQTFKFFDSAKSSKQRKKSMKRQYLTKQKSETISKAPMDKKKQVSPPNENLKTVQLTSRKLPA